MTAADRTADARLTALLDARTGHFLLESGHHGDLWLDLDGLFWSPTALRPLVDELAGRVERRGVDVVCGPLSGGALIALLIADRLGLPFVCTERTPPEGDGLYPAGYRLPPSLSDRLTGMRVAVVDDVMNAGSAARATTAALTAAGARPVTLAALLVLGAAVPEFAEGIGVAVDTLVHRPTVIWDPRSCPLCAGGVPLESAP